MDPKEYQAKTGPLPESAFDGEVKFDPDPEKNCSPASKARMKELIEKLLKAKEATK